MLENEDTKIDKNMTHINNFKINFAVLQMIIYFIKFKWVDIGEKDSG